MDVNAIIDTIISPRLRRWVGYGLASAGVLVVGLLIAVLLALAVFLFRRVECAVAPLVVGLFLSFALRPAFEWVRESCRGRGLSRRWANIAAVLAVVLLPLALVIGGVAAWLVCFGGMDQILSFCAAIPELCRGLIEKVPKLAAAVNSAGVDPDTFFRDKLPRYFINHVGLFSSVTALISTGAFSVVFATCFLLTPLRLSRIVDEARSFPMFSKEGCDFVAGQVQNFENVMSVYLPKQIGINLFEGFIGAAVLCVIGVPYGFVLGFLMGFLNVIPVFGTVAMLPVVLLVAILGEGGCWLRLWFALAGWALVEALDLVLPNMVHGRDMHLSPGVIVFSFLFWGALISPVWGMLLAIPLSAFSVMLWESVKEFFRQKYGKNLHEKNERRRVDES